MLQLPIKNYLIVGSYALGVRPAKDIDVVCFEADVECEYKRVDDYCGSFEFQGRKIELLFADKQESLAMFLKNGIRTSDNRANFVVLYAIKAGHINRPHRQWEKHIMDYHILRKMTDIQLEGELDHPDLLEGIALHKKSTADRMGKQRLPSLKGVSKEQFFDDAVTKFYDHDDIHQWFAHKEKPMYSYMQPDPKEVYCEKEMWDTFTEENKQQCVMEECYVIASERHLIPTIKGLRIGLDPHAAFKWALMRVCTTLCSGWFRDYATNNYFNILNNYNKEYPKILSKHM